MQDQNYFKLSHKIVFYVPSTASKSEPISSQEFEQRTQDTAKLLSSYFGGASIERVQGFYKSDSGEYITETIHKVVSFASSEDLEKYSGDVLNLAANRCRLWEQETIGLEIDSDFYLID